MAIYAIGDVQGCFDELMELLSKIAFNPAQDTLWFAGDLVNRGPKSLEVLRFVSGLGNRAVSVLGNHDLHLLAVAQGQEKYRDKDTFDDILSAPDRDELLEWLRRQPLLYHDAALGYTLIHAGLPPQWDLIEAAGHAAEVEAILRGPEYAAYLEQMYGNEPECWSEQIRGWQRLRYITNCFTRLRFCDASGCLTLEEKGAADSAPAPFMPWFAVPGRLNAELDIVFGHWSTLGPCEVQGIYPLDTGCLWGGWLTALRLDDGRRERISIGCPMRVRPKL